MSAETLTHTVTTDTAEAVTAPVLPADNRAGDGYDWMDPRRHRLVDPAALGQRRMGRRILALHHLRRRPHPRRRWGTVRLRNLRRRRHHHTLVPHPKRLFRSGRHRGVLPLDLQPVRRPRQPPRHGRRTARAGPQTLPRLDGLEAPPVSRPPPAGTQERHTNTR
jgi:hypothetical protein